MRTTRLHDVYFFHNGDFSGDIVIKRHGDELYVPFEAIKDFVAHAVREAKIAKLEQMSSDEVLDIDP